MVRNAVGLLVRIPVQQACLKRPLARHKIAFWAHLCVCCPLHLVVVYLVVLMG